MDQTGSFSHRGNASKEELDRIVGRLNANFGLQLRGPDPTLSPSRRRDQRRSQEEHLNDVLYERIRVLHYKRDKRLADGLGHFQIRAREILSPPRNGIGVSRVDRAALQTCLFNLLPDVNSANQSTWKRRSDEGLHATPKRARAPQDYDYPSAVDHLPVRSRASTAANFPEYTGSINMSMEEIIPSTYQNPLSPNRFFASSRASRPSDVFSSVYSEATAVISQITIDSHYPDPDDSSVCERIDTVLHESFSRDRTGASVQQLRHSPQQSFEPRSVSTSFDVGNTSFRSTELGESPYSSHYVTSSTQLSTLSFHQSNNEAIDGSLDDRLASIWPKFPSPGLNEAPLAVIWEVTRAALHCRVTLDEFDLKYAPNDQWHDQPKLRGMVLTHPLFLGKGLPASNDSATWKIALNEFQTKVKSVTLCAELTFNEKAAGPLYNLRLHPLKLELSHRLARRFGADRFLELLIPSPSSVKDYPAIAKDFDLDKVVRWLTDKPHYFLGRFWIPFYVRSVKGKKTNGKKPTAFQERIYFFACNGNNFRIPRTRGSFPPQEEALTPLKRTTMKLSSLLEWAVNIKNAKNSAQPVTKLFSRLALSLSRTWPTVILERSQIIFCPSDIKTDKVMNDGIGRLSRPLAAKIAESLGLSDCPSAFQARLGSAKGMWMIDVNGENPEKDWIEIYPSQEKWKCDFADPQHRRFEVRNWPSELRSASLNQQFIPVLEAQSYNPAEMRQAIADHLVSALRADLDAQTTAIREPLDLRLWVHQSGLMKNDRSFYGNAEFLGGLPESNADKVAFLLDSGFDQRKMLYLKDLIWDMCKRKAETLEEKMNITIPCSSYVYMAADFSNTLEEDEVHLSFSTKFQVEGFSDTLLENMDVLVARAPAHFPSDIQKVRIVSRPELRKLKDVIIFSTKGKVPLADKLSGGDYDGDMAWVCWDREIVKNFRSAPVPKTPNLFTAGYLGKLETKFDDLMGQAGRDAHHGIADTQIDRACREFMYSALSFNLQPSFLGKCTKYKERLCYRNNSVTNDAAIVLSTLLSNLVDQAKQGILFTLKDWERLCKEYIKTPLRLEDPAYATGDRPRPSRRGGGMHVLDYLRFDVAKVVIHQALTSFNQAIQFSNIQAYDADLTKLFNNTYDAPTATLTGCKEVLDNLKDQVRELVETWKKKNGGGPKEGDDGFAATTKQIHQKWFDMEPPMGLRSTEFVQEILKDWGTEANTSAWQLLKASATFKFQYDKSYRFVWHMAGRQLGFIKARMHPVPKETAPVLVIPEMWGVLRPDKKLIMSLAAQREAAKDSESTAALAEVWDFDDNGTVIDDA
ncbi:RNA-dependent RNA polymerase 1-like protein [Cladobotryum mycophilum]|uniref:RNA-dependent RNA polymerase n=1 Tax=Cladobotryum mycophilum TaxID=491253 RepID=A0ABR0SCB5_9HYPO